MDHVAVVISHPNGAKALDRLIASTQRVIRHFQIPAACFMADDGRDADATHVARAGGLTILPLGERGYGGVINAAVAGSSSPFIITLDGDGLHPPELLPSLYAQRDAAALVIGSRYVRHGFARMPLWRRLCSSVLNNGFRVLLDLPFRDLSSSYRMYRRDLLTTMTPVAATDAALQEILIRTYCNGYTVTEVPMHYIAHPAGRGRPFPSLARLGLDHAITFGAMWRLRNSIESCDYDTRAFFSRIPLQRWWQRRRCTILSDMVGDALRVLDAGCGSTELLNRCPQIVGMDCSLRKVRFMRRPGRRLVNGDTLALPFRDRTFDVVISSQAIEHLPDDPRLFAELVRCLAPGGALLVGTVDYGSWQWPLIERVYGLCKPTGYAHEHVTHYTARGLVERLTRLGLSIERVESICGSEIIIKARKPLSPGAERP